MYFLRRYLWRLGTSRKLFNSLNAQEQKLVKIELTKNGMEVVNNFRGIVTVASSTNSDSSCAVVIKSNKTGWRLPGPYLKYDKTQVRKYSSGLGQPAEVENKAAKEDLNKRDACDEEGLDSEPFEAGYEDGESLSLSEEDMQEISNGDPEVIKKIKFIQLEHAVLREEGHQVPSSIFRRKDWKELLMLDSRSKRRKYFMYLFKTEMTRMNQKQKKMEKAEERIKFMAENPLPTKEEDIYGMCYNLNRNTLFLRLYDATVNKFYNARACSAMVHNPPLVLDCSYDEFMTPREAKNCAKQVEYILAENRTHPEPFNVHLCNADRNSKMMGYLRRMIPTLVDDTFVLNVHEGCFTELFPKKRIVYLSPHTREDLEEYDEDDIYIIGAMVDKSNPRPYSLAKAKKLNVAVKRLPLDKHLLWGMGGKSLTLNQMVRIMLDVRYRRGDWKEAFKVVPTRKLFRGNNLYDNQDQVQNYNHEENESSPYTAPYRKEKKSTVLTDHELLLINRRKGYRRSQMYTPQPQDNRERSKLKVRSLFDDHE